MISNQWYHARATLHVYMRVCVHMYLLTVCVCVCWRHAHAICSISAIVDLWWECTGIGGVPAAISYHLGVSRIHWVKRGIDGDKGATDLPIRVKEHMSRLNEGRKGDERVKGISISRWKEIKWRLRNIKGGVLK